ncbi:helix-turn-helix domain-containing protein [Intestinimonas butyriciproducens]|uniref:helix-turn-helix domain-containing protein n=3 Tax=Intestinimonas butyriciproducens TaxID=1297617 RepID=UPI0034A564AC
MAIRWTPAELEERARADAEIEAGPFRFTDAEIAFGRLFDREVILDRMDSKQKRIAESQRRYYEAHKEEIAETQRRYYEAHKEEIAETQRRYYEAHKEERTEAQRRYREAHKEEIAEGKRELRDARIALGLTQKQAAELLGVAQSTVCYWETISPPKNWREMIEKLTEPA